MTTPSKIDLLLSGGGFRATLFHLGVLRFLYEFRRPDSPVDQCGLQDIRMITGISGGSITASHYAANIDKYIRSFDTPAGELLTFIKTVDLRRQVLTKGVSVSDVLKTHLFKNNATIESVSDRVELVIFGTSLKTGNCIAFRRNSIESSSYDGNAGKLKVEATIPVNSIRLQDLIQASAGFPPFFSSFAFEPFNFHIETK